MPLEQPPTASTLANRARNSFGESAPDFGPISAVRLAIIVYAVRNNPGFDLGDTRVVSEPSPAKPPSESQRHTRPGIEPYWLSFDRPCRDRQEW